MGYDTYNAFEKNYDGALALEQARLMHEYGLVEAGYNVGSQSIHHGRAMANQVVKRHLSLMTSMHWRIAMKRGKWLPTRSSFPRECKALIHKSMSEAVPDSHQVEVDPKLE